MYDIAGQHNRYFDQPVSWPVATIPYLYSVFFIYFFFVFFFCWSKRYSWKEERWAGGAGRSSFERYGGFVFLSFLFLSGGD